MSSYAEKLRDPRWQRKRLEVLQRDGFKCRYCFSADKTLNAHHTVYLRGRDPWEYEDNLIICLCDECHTQWHDFKDSLDQYFAYLNAENIEYAKDAVFEILKAQILEERAARMPDAA